MSCLKPIARRSFAFVVLAGLASFSTAVPARGQFFGGWGWGYGTVAFGPWGLGYGYGAMAYPAFGMPAWDGMGWGYGYPYGGAPLTFGGYPGWGWPYYDGGWALTSGIGAMAVEAAVIERGLHGVLPQGQRLAPGRYKMTITIEPADARTGPPKQ